MKRISFAASVLGIVFAAQGAFAQDPILGSMKFLYDDAKQNVIGAAAKADASVYGFNPPMRRVPLRSS